MSMQSKKTKMVVIAIVIAIILVGLGSYAYFTMKPTSKQHLIVSTTTSLYETGLLDIIKVEFEKQYPSINVSFISQGTGLAIQTAMRGDADMILVHDPARELKFLEEEYGVNRKVVAYNFFVIAGPSDDPANVKGLSPIEAFKKIKQVGDKNSVIWVSRGDDSGTHSKEKQIWKAVGFDVADLRTMDWYLEAGAGMTATLRLTDEKNGYTLVDLGSYLNNYANRNIKLEIIVDTGKDTLNVYSVIANNPRKTEGSDSNFDASMKFIDFLVSDGAQQILADFGKDKFGKSLFNPYIKLLQTGDKPELIQWIQDLAYFDETECPPQYRYQADHLYQIIYGGLIISPIVVDL
ncbi:substrate-binding domain-containing protein [[Eubacterium] cellulosolvens]